MSVNRHKPHVLVLPEDDANRQIANGFIYDLDNRYIQVLPIAAGWTKAVDQFINDHAPRMRQYPDRMMVLLIDFDNCKDRLSFIKRQIPKDLDHRVFVIGSWTAPEKLKNDMETSFEKIGESLAKDCSEDTNHTWGHTLLNHNERELTRLRLSVKPIIFAG